MTKKENERCPYCLGTNLRPKGWNTKRTKRRMKCGRCKKHMVLSGTDWFVRKEHIQYESINSIAYNYWNVCHYVGFVVCLKELFPS